ncbi:MAG: asparagine--tRNA ligase [Acidobacteria bacterium RIFCSPLOWO2_02_FULL_65_29]|nr:MAG: asparagine--tRNA ligase [Acidobacteria bacterium RIFCSPLOWO2_02_FULL_65_29]
MHVYIEDIGKHEGEDVTIKGWLHNRRSSGKIHFLILRDGTGFIQAVMSKAAVGEESFRAADHLSQETSVVVAGTARADTRAPSGYEIDVKSLEIVGSSHDYPITPKEHGVDYLLDRRHLWIRSERQQAILRVRHEIINAVRDFFNGRGFILADTPIFTPAACEGTTTLFPAQYFEEQTAYLTQSGQLYNEANAMALGKVYCFGPTFRAEKSKTRRHLTEFWMVEPEMAWADLNDVMNLAEDLVVSIVGRVLDKRRRELTVLERDLSKLESIQKPFPRISYDEAVKKLQAGGLPIEWGGDFGGPDETALSEAFDRPVMIDRYPAAVKAFYMKPDPDRPELALGVDVLAPEGYGEIIGGGERLADLDLLIERIKAHGLPQEAFEWYLDLRRYGTVPHGGFGMGIERVVAWICKLEHVRETIPYPRMLNRLYP